MTNPILSDELVEVVARKIHETFWLCQYGDEVGTAKSVALSTWESSKLMRMAEASAAIPLIQAELLRGMMAWVDESLFDELHDQVIASITGYAKENNLDIGEGERMVDEWPYSKVVKGIERLAYSRGLEDAAKVALEMEKPNLMYKTPSGRAHYIEAQTPITNAIRALKQKDKTGG